MVAIEGKGEELARYVGADAAMALMRWCQLTGRDVRVPAGAWRGTGYTDAVVAPLFVTEVGSGTRLVLVKTLPPGQVTEAAAHRLALHEAPSAFRPHLVDLLMDPIATPAGGAVMFQALAGDSRDWRPMADLPSERVADACEVVTQAVLEDWNHDLRVETVREIDLLRDAIEQTRVHGRVPDDFAEISDGSLPSSTGDPVPNPTTLLTDDRILGDRRIDIVTGRVHGDLHGQNILIEQGEYRIVSDTFRLIDLMTYKEAAPLDRDLVTMLLSATAGLLSDLSPSQRGLLLRVFVRPEADVPAALPESAVAPLRAIYPTAARLLSRTGAELWRRQYLLSLVAHGLKFTTFTNLGTPNRLWFFLLAGHAAGKILGGQSPADVAAARNSFEDAPIMPPSGSKSKPVGRLRVFLCHASADRQAARDLSERLLGEGYDVWLDENNLLPGHDWDYEIRKAVRSSDVVLAIISSRSVDKIGYVQRELRPALDAADERPEGSIYLIPLLLDEVRVPSRLAKWQWVETAHQQWFDRLLSALRLVAPTTSVDREIVAPASPSEPAVANLLSLDSNPNRLESGQTMRIEYRVQLWSKSTVAVTLGASLLDRNHREYYDAARDREVILQPGLAVYSRQLTVPEATPAGKYRLVGAIWFRRIGEQRLANMDRGFVIDILG